MINSIVVHIIMAIGVLGTIGFLVMVAHQNHDFAPMAIALILMLSMCLGALSVLIVEGISQWMS